jgi:hypothetical protein
MANKYEAYRRALQGIDETNILFPRYAEDVLDALVLQTLNKKPGSATFQAGQPKVN